jgi:hypothetical protein
MSRVKLAAALIARPALTAMIVVKTTEAMRASNGKPPSS